MIETEKAILFEKLETIPEYIDFLRTSKNGKAKKLKDGIIETLYNDFIYVSYGNMVKEGDQVKLDFDEYKMTSNMQTIASGVSENEHLNTAYFKCFIVGKREKIIQNDIFSVFVHELELNTEEKPFQLKFGNYRYWRKYKKLNNGYFEHMATNEEVFTYNDNNQLSDKAGYELLGIQNRYFFTNKPDEKVFKRYDEKIKDLEKELEETRYKISELRESQFHYLSAKRDLYIDNLVTKVERVKRILADLKIKQKKNLILNEDYNFFKKSSFSQLLYFDNNSNKIKNKYLLKLADKDPLYYLKAAKIDSQALEITKQKVDGQELKNFIEAAKAFRSFYSLDIFKNTFLSTDNILENGKKPLSSLFYSKLHSYLAHLWLDDKKSFASFSLKKKEEQEKKENTEDYRYNHAQYFKELSTHNKIKAFSAEEKEKQITKDINNI